MHALISFTCLSQLICLLYVNILNTMIQAQNVNSIQSCDLKKKTKQLSALYAADEAYKPNVTSDGKLQECNCNLKELDQSTRSPTAN